MEPTATTPATGTGRDAGATGSGAAPRRDSGPNLQRDLQSLLGDALRRACAQTRSDRAAAWMKRSVGAPVAVAGTGERRALAAVPIDAVSACLALTRAADLGCCDHPALRALAQTHGFGSAVALRTREGAAVVAVFAGGPADPAGSVRPRTIAALDAVATRLRGPLSAARAQARFARLDAEVQRLDRLAALGELTGEVVHEVRNPLVSVKTFLELLPERIDDREFTEDFRAVVVDEVRRLERLLDALLEHARPGTGADDTAGCSVGELFDTLARLLAVRAREAQVDLQYELSEGADATRVAMSADALRQVTLNLVLNALRMTPSGGRVTLRARALAGEGAVELCVDDSGPGVAPAARARVFEPFVSSRRIGSGGLGLSITRRLVEDAGGSIGVSRSPEGGARFEVRLSAAPSD